MQRKFHRLIQAIKNIVRTGDRFDQVLMNQGRLLSAAFRDHHYKHLWDVEFKIFSQWGEDGILQYLIANIDITHRTFIEFGVEDFYESNCRFLMSKDVWQGYVIDGSPTNVATIEASDFFWKYPLAAKASFITRENVATLLDESGFDKDIGILSVDIDGVDYFVLEALAEWRPRILVVEYNGVFGIDRPVSVPYRADFQRTAQHPSNMYYGASLAAYHHLATSRGYALVGVNSVGSNAFFVRRELLNQRVRETSIAACYRTSCFREGRDDSGRLTMLSGARRREPIAHLPLVDVVSGASLLVGDLGYAD
jgi:hypothetical protein